MIETEISKLKQGKKKMVVRVYVASLGNRKSMGAFSIWVLLTVFTSPLPLVHSFGLLSLCFHVDCEVVFNGMAQPRSRRVPRY
jgi:hypothetical protein